jgi:hypothetical protein
MKLAVAKTNRVVRRSSVPHHLGDSKSAGLRPVGFDPLPAPLLKLLTYLSKMTYGEHNSGQSDVQPESLIFQEQNGHSPHPIYFDKVRKSS